MGSDAGARVRTERETGERESARDEPAPPATDRTDEDDRDGDPVDGRHGRECRSTGGEAAGYNAVPTGA